MREEAVVFGSNEAAVLVIRLTACGVLGIFGVSAPAKPFSCVTLASFRLRPPIARRGLKGIIPSASLGLRIFSRVKVNLRAGIRILLSYQCLGLQKEELEKRSSVESAKYY